MRRMKGSLCALALVLTLPTGALAVTGKTYALELYSLDEERSKKTGLPGLSGSPSFGLKQSSRNRNCRLQLRCGSCLYAAHRGTLGLPP